MQSLSAPFTFLQPFLDFGYYPTQVTHGTPGYYPTQVTHGTPGYYPTQVTHGTPAVHPWFSMGCVCHLSFLCD